MQILAGDIGGTKTELVIYEGEPGRLAQRSRVRVASSEHAGLLEIAAPLVRGMRLDAAVFGVAGPVRDGRCKTTNLPWQLDEITLSDSLGCPVRLLNDFSAVVLGVEELKPSELHVLQVGERDPSGPIAVLGAGTGMGEGIGVRSADGLEALASEGGHRDLAPRNGVEDRLLTHLRGQLGGRVSVERVVSGPGLIMLYRFVVAEGLAPERSEVAAELLAGDAAAVIGRRGQDGSDAACVRALDLFIGLYGAEAGNLALTLLPTRGLYIAGGIAPKLIERIARGDFMAALLDKGRMATMLSKIPVAVVLEPRVGLLGSRVAGVRLATR